jgi:hypothetical protein
MQLINVLMFFFSKAFHRTQSVYSYAGIVETVVLVSFSDMLPVLMTFIVSSVIIIVLKIYLGPLRHIPLDLEEAPGLVILVLVSPGCDVASHDTGKPI